MRFDARRYSLRRPGAVGNARVWASSSLLPRESILNPVMWITVIEHLFYHTGQDDSAPVPASVSRRYGPRRLPDVAALEFKLPELEAAIADYHRIVAHARFAFAGD